eukprot:868817-Prorocentrum_minimum.AAC.1
MGGSDRRGSGGRGGRGGGSGGSRGSGGSGKSCVVGKGSDVSLLLNLWKQQVARLRAQQTRTQHGTPDEQTDFRVQVDEDRGASRDTRCLLDGLRAHHNGDGSVDGHVLGAIWHEDLGEGFERLIGRVKNGRRKYPLRNPPCSTYEAFLQMRLHSTYDSGGRLEPLGVTQTWFLLGSTTTYCCFDVQDAYWAHREATLTRPLASRIPKLLCQFRCQPEHRQRSPARIRAKPYPKSHSNIARLSLLLMLAEERLPNKEATEPVYETADHLQKKIECVPYLPPSLATWRRYLESWWATGPASSTPARELKGLSEVRH